VGKAADVFGRVEAKLDVGAVLGGSARREELDQLDGALQERVAVAAEVLPVPIGAIDCDRAEGGAEFDQGLEVDERFPAARGRAVALRVEPPGYRRLAP